MNILIITQDFPPIPGGISVFLYNICIQLCYLGHRVDVLAPTCEGSAEVDAGQPYHVYRYVSPRRFSSIAPIRCTLTLHRRHHYDLVFIGHFMTTHALGVLALHSLWGTPYVLLCHGNDLYYSISNWMDKLAAYPLFRNASSILSNSHFTAERVRRKGYKGTVEILSPGVDPYQFRPALETSTLIRRYNLEGRKVVLSVGRLVERKGHVQVLRALPDVIKKVSNVLYVIAGIGEEAGRGYTSWCPICSIGSTSFAC